MVGGLAFFWKVEIGGLGQRGTPQKLNCSSAQNTWYCLIQFTPSPILLVPINPAVCSHFLYWIGRTDLDLFSLESASSSRCCLDGFPLLGLLARKVGGHCFLIITLKLGIATVLLLPQYEKYVYRHQNDTCSIFQATHAGWSDSDFFHVPKLLYPHENSPRVSSQLGDFRESLICAILASRSVETNFKWIVMY